MNPWILVPQKGTYFKMLIMVITDPQEDHITIFNLLFSFTASYHPKLKVAYRLASRGLSLIRDHSGLHAPTFVTRYFSSSSFYLFF